VGTIDGLDASLVPGTTKSTLPGLSPMDSLFIAALSLHTLVITMALHSVTSYLPNWLLSRGVNQSWMGGFVAMTTIGNFVAAVIFQPVFKAMPNETVVAGAAFFAAVSMYVTAIVPEHFTGATLGGLFLATRFCTGFCDGLATVAGSSVCLRMVPEEHFPALTSVFEITRTLGAFVGPIMGGWVYEKAGY